MMPPHFFAVHLHGLAPCFFFENCSWHSRCRFGLFIRDDTATVLDFPPHTLLCFFLVPAKTLSHFLSLSAARRVGRLRATSRGNAARRPCLHTLSLSPPVLEHSSPSWCASVFAHGAETGRAGWRRRCKVALSVSADVGCCVLLCVRVCAAMRGGGDVGVHRMQPVMPKRACWPSVIGDVICSTMMEKQNQRAIRGSVHLAEETAPSSVRCSRLVM